MKPVPVLLAMLWYVPLHAEVGYTRDIRPILSQHCFKCHGTDQQKGGLRLDQGGNATTELKSGRKAILPGNAEASELMRRVISADEDEVMPRKGPRLSEAQVATLRKWITAGANYELHWAYVKPFRPATTPSGLIPPSKDDACASPATLIRRVTLDLTGLPPTLAEVEAFEHDASPDAFEKVVDRLLKSGRFGEKWARHWLDLARYGDSAGYQHDMEMPLWLYRDWVIRAFNADMPFDRFTIEQIAGDLLPGATTDQRIATGFNRCSTATLGADNDAEELRAQLLWDRVNTLGTTWLGSSLECAQCHNHKFDPFTQRDYYSLLAYFNSTVNELTFHPGDHYYITGGVLELPIGDAQRAALENVRRQIADEFVQIERETGGPEGTALPTIRRLLVSPPQDRTPERIAYLFVDELNKGQKIPPAISPHVERIKELAVKLDDTRAPRSLVLEEGPVRASHVLLRGNVKTPGDEVHPGTPAVLPPLPGDAPSNRMGLARWLVSRDNPLTARVMVNRWWAELFGRGIVTTPEDFGLQGELPADQATLDWLAVEFMEHNWSMKHLLKQIVLSRTYRAPAPKFPRARLDAETLRDNVLAIAGLLHHRTGGRPVPVDGEHPVLDVRSIYLRHQRGEPYATFATFDAPDRFACTTRRPRSNTPLQALALLNEPAFTAAAKALGERILKDLPEVGTQERATQMFRLCVARKPKPEETAELVQLHDSKIARGGNETDAWFVVANVLLNLDETITKE